jgi:hypothetical protein
VTSARRRPLLVALVAGAFTLVGCSDAGSAVAPPAAGPGDAVDVAPATDRDTLVLVLPALELLDAAEHARLRLVAERALAAAIPPGASTRTRLVVPATADITAALVESAARDGATVCVLGASSQGSLEATLAVYPALQACGLGPAGSPAVLRLDVDLEALGARLGRSARLAAGEDTVVILAGRDGMLDTRWGRGVERGAAGGPVAVVSDVAALRSAVAALAGPAGVGGGFAAREPAAPGEVPSILPAPGRPVGAVVLDASPGTRDLALELLAQGIPIVAPRSVVADVAGDAPVVVRWRVLWDLPLTAVLRGVAPGPNGGAEPFPPLLSLDEVIVLEDGPAAVAERAQVD